jgi:hypothetical protein
VGILPVSGLSQEVSLLTGPTHAQGHSTYNWQLEYQQRLDERLSASLSWINEGHILQHRRDGATAQLWLLQPVARRLKVGVAVGPYLYFDTVPNDEDKGYGDHHGLGVAATGGLWWQVWGPLDLELRVTGLWVQGDINTRSAMLGAGYRFTNFLERTRPAGERATAAHDWQDGSQTISVIAGVSTLNSLAIRSWNTYGLDYQYGLGSWYGVAATGVVDSGTHSPHDRVAVQARIFRRIEDSPLTLTAGVGPAVTLIQSGSPSQEPVEGMLLLRAAWNLTQRLSLQASWFRTFTEDDHDLDIITGGLAWNF